MSDRGASEHADGGWLLSAIPLQLNDGPTAACPPGGETLLWEERSPRALLSLKLAANNRSNLVSSSVKCSPLPPPNHPHPRVQPPAPVQSALGAQEQGSKDQLLCSGFILMMFFPACHWNFCTFSTSGENLFSLVPGENFSFIPTLWIPTEDPSPISSELFYFSPVLMKDWKHFTYIGT